MKGTRYIQNKTQIGKLRAGVKASAVILPLLGITWLFGLLSFTSEIIVFQYIFTISNSLQGLMIFIFHCVLNKQVRVSECRYCEHSLHLTLGLMPPSSPQRLLPHFIWEMFMLSTFVFDSCPFSFVKSVASIGTQLFENKLEWKVGSELR